MTFQQKGVITVLFISSIFLNSCSSNSIYIYSKDGTMKGEVLKDQEKSSFLGVLLAIFPGILWHGIGHRYAGDSKKAEQIEQFEVLSLVSSGAGLGLYYGGEEARRNNLDGLKMSLYISAGTFAGFGALGFLGTWLYDIIYTPNAVAKYNRNLYLSQDDDE